MSTVSRTRHTAKVAIAQRKNRRQPDEQDVYRDIIVRTIMQNLYEKQLKYWDGQLLKLSRENAESLGRASDGIAYAIHWKGRRYIPTKLNWTMEFDKAYCLPLNDKMPDFKTRMDEIAEEYSELCEEKYEAERFLVNLVSFAAPPERLRSILGRSLYRLVEERIEKFCAGFTDASWQLNDDFSLKTFVDCNQDIVKKMNARVMLNLVT